MLSLGETYVCSCASAILCIRAECDRIGASSNALAVFILVGDGDGGRGIFEGDCTGDWTFDDRSARACFLGDCILQADSNCSSGFDIVVMSVSCAGKLCELAGVSRRAGQEISRQGPGQRICFAGQCDLIDCRLDH